MPENIDAWRRDRPKQTAGLIRRRPQNGVRGGDDQFEQAQLLRLHVHAAVGADIRLDPFEQPESRAVPGVQPIDLGVLLRHLGDIDMPPAMRSPYE